MIGTARGIQVSTDELYDMIQETDVFVIVDWQMYQATSVMVFGDRVEVTLTPCVGQDWVLQVAKADYEEPMWEVEGQS